MDLKGEPERQPVKAGGRGAYLSVVVVQACAAITVVMAAVKAFDTTAIVTKYSECVPWQVRLGLRFPTHGLGHLPQPSPPPCWPLLGVLK